MWRAVHDEGGARGVRRRLPPADRPPHPPDGDSHTRHHTPGYVGWGGKGFAKEGMLVIVNGSIARFV